MGQQPRLFHESINDALREVVQALGGAKKVGPAMRPEKTMDDAARWVLDCLNPDRRDRFNPDQVLWLLREGKKIDCHAAARFFMLEAGYSEPTPVDPTVQRDRLADELAKACELF